MRALDCSLISPAAQLRAHLELLAELRSPISQLSGIRFHLPPAISLPGLRNRATQLRVFLKAELRKSAEELAVREDPATHTLILYRKDRRGAAFPDRQPRGHANSASPIPSAPLPPPLLALQIMAGHYDRSSPLTARFAIPANRATYLALRDGGWFSPQFLAEAEETFASALALIAQQEEKRKSRTYVWDSVLASLRRGEAPQPSQLTALASLRTSIPETQRKELETFGIPLTA